MNEPKELNFEAAKIISIEIVERIAPHVGVQHIVYQWPDGSQYTVVETVIFHNAGNPTLSRLYQP